MVRSKPKPAMGVPADTGNQGMYPGAHPTAPGGMSEVNLRIELAETHGVSMDESRAMSWSEKIEAVCQGRRRLEREDPARYEALSKPPVDETAEALAAVEADADDLAETGVDPITTDEDDDFSDLDFDDEPTDLDKWAEIIEESRAQVDPDIAAVYDVPADQLHTIDADMLDYVVAADYSPPLIDVAAVFEDEEDAGFEAEVDAMLSEPKVKPTPIFIGMPDTFDYIFDGHYGASPSGAERWAHCTASLEASRAFLETLTPNQQKQLAQAGTAARQGTTAHAAGEAELLLMLGLITQEEYDNAILDLTISPADDEAYDEEMAEHLHEYVDYVRQLHQAGRPLAIEARVRAKVWLTDAHDGEVHEIPGSADCGALPSEDEPNVITVADLKYGNGIDVSVEANPQVRIYALGFLAKYVEDGGDLDDIDTLEYVIVQPRLGGIKPWRESIDDLFTWRDEVLAPALTKALYGQAEGATFSPSEDACQWCLVRGGCPALIEDRMAAGASMFDEVLEAEVSGNPINPMTLSNERLGEVLAQITAVADLKDDIKAEVQRRLHRGQHVPLHELVNYTPARSWKDGAVEAIKEAVESGTIPSIYKPPAIMTPTQALTLLKEQEDARTWVEQHVDVHDVVPVVGPDAARRAARGDRRKSWNGRAPEDMFGDESTDEDPAPSAIESMFGVEG